MDVELVLYIPAPILPIRFSIPSNLGVTTKLQILYYLTTTWYLFTCVHFAVCINRSGGLYDEDYIQKRIDRADAVEESGDKLSSTLHASGRDDMSILAMQRLNDQYVPYR
jgi:hypothetical protein